METLIDGLIYIVGFVLTYIFGALIMLFTFAAVIYLAHKWFETR